MAILPVLDLMNGQIVRGIAGRREEYRPIVSRLADDAAPRTIARAFRDRFGFTELYLADLDAIRGGAPAEAIYEELLADGFCLWIDAGVRDFDGATFQTLARAEASTVIVGLETVDGPDPLRRMVERIGPARVVFSLDLNDGQLLARRSLWRTDDPRRIAEHAIASLGITRMIVLDLARVGVSSGVGTEALCRDIHHAHPEVELTAGGGIRGSDDIRSLLTTGVRRVLVASALHDGRLTPADVKKYTAHR